MALWDVSKNNILTLNKVKQLKNGKISCNLLAGISPTRPMRGDKILVCSNEKLLFNLDQSCSSTELTKPACQLSSFSTRDYKAKVVD